MKLSKLVIACLFAIPLTLQANDELSLKSAFKDSFLVGTALNSEQIYMRDTKGIELVKKQFNAITPENITKWEAIHPENGKYDFRASDAFVKFGQDNNMFMIGHPLIWHSQTPKWVFEDENGNPMSRDGLIERMREHIYTVAGHYKDKMHAWDVVNEALNDDGTMRETNWYKIIGKDYLLKAFQFAQEAAPNVELYYNDYSLENPAKRAGAVELVKYLQENGVKITGIGTQGHFGLDYPTLAELEDTIVAFGNLNIKVMVTEMDLDVLPAAFSYQGADISKNAELRAEINPYENGLTPEMEEKHAQRYTELFEIFNKHKNVISRVTFWGVADGDSWKNNWPVRGRTNYTMLFDRNHQPKLAFDRVIQTIK